MVKESAKLIDFVAAHAERAVLRRRAELAAARRAMLSRSGFNAHGVFIPRGMAYVADNPDYPRSPASITLLRGQHGSHQGV